MTIDIRPVDPADDDALGDLLAVRHAFQAELEPDDPLVSAAELAADLAMTTTLKRRQAYVALVDGEPAGAVEYELLLDAGNHHLLDTEMGYVVPSRRRCGVATALLRETLPALAATGRTSLLLWCHDDAGAAFCAGIGLTHRQDERCSRLRIADLDPDQQQSWIDDAAARDDGYRLVALGERCPDDLVAPYCEALDAMEDAPLGDLDFVPPRTEEALVRSREAAWAGAGLIAVRTLAVGPDGSGAGVSELFVQPLRPSLGWQGDTAVVAAHRGRRLGRWLKAENLAATRARFPALATVETYNAQENPWMLAINIDMGFRPHLIWSGWQGPVAGVLDRLGG